MSIERLEPATSDDTAAMRDMVRAIEKAIAMARQRKYRFLTYLLEMARLEAANLSGTPKH